MTVMCLHTDEFCYGGNKDFEERIIGDFKERIKIGEVESI